MKAMTAKQGQSTMNKLIKLIALLTLSALSLSALAEVNSGTGLPQDQVKSLLEPLLVWLLELMKHD